MKVIREEKVYILKGQFAIPKKKTEEQLLLKNEVIKHKGNIPALKGKYYNL